MALVTQLPWDLPWLQGIPLWGVTQLSSFAFQGCPGRRGLVGPKGDKVSIPENTGRYGMGCRVRGKYHGWFGLVWVFFIKRAV